MSQRLADGSSARNRMWREYYEESYGGRTP